VVVNRTPTVGKNGRVTSAGVSARARRGDIQGLRAVAILTVVAFHAFDGVLPGGFVGVDVFFVISGFLIAGILIREQAATGTISLTGFWARRVRRLMPAILVVSIITLAVSWVRLNPLPLVRTLDNAGWSLLSLANVRLANSPTGGYFANAVENPFLHFWSLSVEEQFYVFLPLLLLLVGLARRAWAVPVLIGVVFVGSLVASALLSAENDPNAFYSIGTRAWELAIGAGLAWFTASVRATPPSWTRVAAFVAGLAGIVVAAGWFTASMPWPGWAALLPTVGTALIIWAGTGGSAGWVTRILDNPVARYIGDVSFSFYLWHWPLLVLAPGEFAADPRLRLALVIGAFGLAVLTYHFVEQPFQRMRRAARPRRILAIGLPAAAVLAAASFVASAVVMPNSGLRVDPLPAQYQSLDQGPGTVPAAIPSNVRPSLLDVGYDLQDVYGECFRAGFNECWSGDPEGEKTVLVTGDSYAGMFWPSIEQAASEHGWRVVIVAKAGCALLVPTPLEPDSSDEWTACVQWREFALERAAELNPSVILYINSMGRIDGPDFAEWIPGAKAAVEQLEQLAPVVLLAPTPSFPYLAEQCLGPAFFNPAACSLPIDQVVRPPTLELAAEIAESGGADLLDLNGILCDAEGMCPMIVGDTIMYRDSGHISNAYSTHFATVFGEVLRPYLDD
jgi:peptidoglycan/LPS O-acetylase OafA/YrhL